MPLQETSGTASYDAFGGGAAAVPTYIEDVFSTYLYTGTTSPVTVNNGIDLANKGGLVWIKSRSNAVNHALVDSARSAGYVLNSNTTNAEQNYSADWNGFTATGFSVSDSQSLWNLNGYTYASWTFRKQPKFFDVVTYTGDGVAGRQIAHSLGATPGCIIVKRTNTTGNWNVYHRSLGATDNIYLNLTNATSPTSIPWNDTAPTSTYFVVGGGYTNNPGDTYVAYLFAHDTATDGVIQCGSYTGNGLDAGPQISLGWEPQWVLLKNTSTGGYNWAIVDNMIGGILGVDTGATKFLAPNVSNAELSANPPLVKATPTGFQIVNPGDLANANGSTYIYIAIRRGPMKTPTSGTSVYYPDAYTGTGALNVQTAPNFPPDLLVGNRRTSWGAAWFDKLRGPSKLLFSYDTAAEVTTSGTDLKSFDQLGFTLNAANFETSLNSSGASDILWNFRRAPGFFDVVCYTGTGSAHNETHNLGVVPELIIVKNRSNTFNWTVYSSAVCSLNGQYLMFTTDEKQSGGSSMWGINPLTDPPNMTSTTFSLGYAQPVNGSGSNYVAYLFASCPGVSKVFSFTGNGTTQTINCGFTGGARFVLLKASSATGGWYVYDTARGMTTLTDPYLFLNSTAAETATLGSVTTVTGGFAVNEAITTGVNTNGVTYIGLAIA